MEVTRLFDFIDYQLENFPLDKSFGRRVRGEWVFYSTRQIIDQANRVSMGLLKMGVKPGDKIATVTYKNRPEWTVLDLGMMQVGAINVPVYPTISPREYEYIFNDAAVVYCFVGDDDKTGTPDDLYQKVNQAKVNVPTLIDIFTFDKQAGRRFWEEIFEDEGMEEVIRVKNSIHPDDLATLIYTSGTTGNPKGVMLSHHNIVSNVKSVRPIIPIDPGDRALSFLPICHVFERVVSYAYMFFGGSVYFTGTENLGGDEGDLKSVKPHFFTTVPRLLEKVYDKILNKGLDLKGIKRGLFFWALHMTDHYEFDKKYTGFAALKFKIADRLVFSKWREALGGNVKGVITGAAACPVKIARVFSAAGVPIREGYGMTETSPGLSINRFEKGGAMLGTVGPAIDGVELMIDESDKSYIKGEGEIMACGPNVMVGYYNKPEETEKVIRIIDGKRWYFTGDIGMFVYGKDGTRFLKITDRKKELLKTSGGKYVAPAPIENKYRENFLVEQIMVVGENRRFVSALIVPAVETLKEWCHKHNIQWTSLQEMVLDPKVLARYQEIVDHYNPNFGHIEQIKKFMLVDQPWETVKSDGTEAELTPTLKLKRRVILEKYKALIEEMYV